MATLDRNEWPLCSEIRSVGGVVPTYDQFGEENELDAFVGCLAAEDLDVGQGPLGLPQVSIHAHAGNTYVFHGLSVPAMAMGRPGWYRNVRSSTESIRSIRQE